MQRTLRFGVMCQDTNLRAWQAETLRRLEAINGVTLAVRISPTADGSPAPGVRGSLGRLASSETTLWDTFNNGYVARRAACLARVDCSEQFRDAATVEANPERRGKFSEYFSDGDVATIASHDLDFVLRFAFGIIRGDILSAARHGLWSFHHGDEEAFRGSPPAYWEIDTSSPTSGVLLQRLTDRLDGGVVLRKGWVRTAAHSYVRNTDLVHFAGVDFPAQVCRDLLADDAGYLDAEPSPTDAPIYHKPSDVELVRFGAKVGLTFLKQQTQNLFRADQWNVGLVRRPIECFLDPSFDPEILWFDDDRGTNHYLADPFPDPAAPSRAALVEDYDYRSRLGTISRLDFDTMQRTPVAIADDRHASYPFTFEAAGHRYMAAQISGARGVQLLRSTSRGLAPAEHLAIDAEVLDPTIFSHENRWWLMFTPAGRSSLTELHVWWANQLDGPWRPHRQNPVKTDIRSARPAGTPFVHGGRLFRPAQDCSTSYGGAVAMMSVDTLTPTRFDESVVRIIEPDPSWPYPDGMHTLSSAGAVTFLDAKRHVFNPYESRSELRARFSRLLGRRGRA